MIVGSYVHNLKKKGFKQDLKYKIIFICLSVSFFLQPDDRGTVSLSYTLSVQQC